MTSDRYKPFDAVSREIDNLVDRRRIINTLIALYPYVGLLSLVPLTFLFAYKTLKGLLSSLVNIANPTFV
jgi:hypothetical protein